MKNTTTPNIRIGMIGLGDIAAKVYLPELAHRPDVDIVGIASRRAETVQHYGQLYRVNERFTAVEDLLRQGPDVVFVHAATNAHYDIVLQCLRSGKHVFVDKPLTDNIDQTRELTQIATDSGLLLAVGFNRRFAPLIVKARQAVDNPTFVSFEKHRAAPYRTTARETISHGLIHLIDTLAWILDNKVELTDFRLRTDSSGHLRLAAGTCNSVNTTAHFSKGTDAGKDQERLSLHGAEVSAEVTDLEQLQIHTAATSTTELVTFGSWDTIQYRRGFSDLISHVLAHLDNPKSCTVSADQTLLTHELVESVLAWPR